MNDKKGWRKKRVKWEEYESEKMGILEVCREGGKGRIYEGGWRAECMGKIRVKKGKTE